MPHFHPCNFSANLGNISKQAFIKLENVWQSLAYSPLGAIVSPPSKYL